VSGLARVAYRGDVRCGVLQDYHVRLLAPELDDPVAALSGATFSELEAGAAPPVGLDAVTILAPVRPSKVICVGLNYHDHAAEQALEPPAMPILFAKLPNAVSGQDASVELASPETDYEAELAVVIGRTTRDIPVAAALDHVAGYTCMNDVSARDRQREDGQFTLAKSYDGFAPLGPALVPRERLGDAGDLEILCRVNGEVRQRSRTSQLVFGVAALVSYCSERLTLLPGDVISTGTPGGVGAFLDPPRFLTHGDEVEVEVEGVGVLRTRFRRAAAGFAHRGPPA